MYAQQIDGYPNIEFKTKDELEQRKQEIREQLATALDKNEFYLNYQPKFCSKLEKIVGIECLLRWENEVLGKVSPDEFIPIAEETGYIIKIGDYVLDQACKLSYLFKLQNILDIKVAINVCPIQFNKNRLLESIKHSLKKWCVEPTTIEIEITENVLIKNINKSKIMLEELRNMGINIWLDDFGKSYSNFVYITKLPFTGIKIDKVFIDDITKNKKQQVVVNKIIEISNLLGLKSVAEGVETPQQAKMLKDFQCNELQGYYYSKPVSKHNIIKLIKKCN